MYRNKRLVRIQNKPEIMFSNPVVLVRQTQVLVNEPDLAWSKFWSKIWSKYVFNIRLRFHSLELNFYVWRFFQCFNNLLSFFLFHKFAAQLIHIKQLMWYPHNARNFNNIDSPLFFVPRHNVFIISKWFQRLRQQCLLPLVLETIRDQLSSTVLIARWIIIDSASFYQLYKQISRITMTSFSLGLGDWSSLIIVRLDNICHRYCNRTRCTYNCSRIFPCWKVYLLTLLALFKQVLSCLPKRHNQDYNNWCIHKRSRIKTVG